MSTKIIQESFNALKNYCEVNNYTGWDPYDGLNSKIFQSTPFKKSSFARLAWIQGFKRSPINFRKLLLVPKQHNAKGIALFLTGYCNLYKAQQKAGAEQFGTQDEILDTINHLSKLLLDMKSKGYSGACWGYNFDWQNRVFFQPKYTPTVVPTSFCADALFNAHEITTNKLYLETALSACDYITKDLNRNYLSKDEFIFSYSPLDDSQVYNASLLGARLLAKAYTFLSNEEWKELSIAATRTIVNKQDKDGSWIYGAATVQNWIDSYHTGYNLECIHEIGRYLNTNEFQESFQTGLKFYLNSFFLEDGTPRYYHNKTYPIDIHSPAQLIATLSKTGNLIKNAGLANKVLEWTIENMQSTKGYFYYQIKKVSSSKIPYIRWAQAWMFYAFSEYFKVMINEDLD